MHTTKAYTLQLRHSGLISNLRCVRQLPPWPSATGTRLTMKNHCDVNLTFCSSATCARVFWRPRPIDSRDVSRGAAVHTVSFRINIYIYICVYHAESSVKLERIKYCGGLFCLRPIVLTQTADGVLCMIMMRPLGIFPRAPSSSRRSFRVRGALYLKYILRRVDQCRH